MGTHILSLSLSQKAIARSHARGTAESARGAAPARKSRAECEKEEAETDRPTGQRGARHLASTRIWTEMEDEQDNLLSRRKGRGGALPLPGWLENACSL